MESVTKVDTSKSSFSNWTFQGLTITVSSELFQTNFQSLSKM